MKYLSYIFIAFLIACNDKNETTREKAPNISKRIVDMKQMEPEIADYSHKTLHSSIQSYKAPIALLETEKFRIRIDKLEDGGYRYASWNRGASMKVKPSLALRMDKEELIQKGENDIYSFNNGKYTYTVIINREKQDRYHLSTLRVDNGNSNLLEVTAKFRSYTDEINFPWAVLTRTGYNPKFYSDSTLIIDEKLYEKLQMNKVFDLSSYDRTIVNYLYETNDIHHVEINVDSMEEYFYFLVTYSHDLQLIDHQQVGKGDPHHGFWYQSYDIIPQAEASLIVRSSYRLNDKEDILKARDTLMLLHNGTFTKLSLNSNRYGGTFAYQSEGDGPYGTAYLYPNSDNTLLFHLDLNRGAPSYNMGSITGQMHLKTNGTASFIQVEPAYLNCNLKFVFKDDLLMVRTVGQANACGFGFGVSANVDFKKTNTEVPQYFLNGEGDQVWFKKLNMKSSFGKK